MAVLNVQDEFQSGDTVTATNLNNLVKDASFNADTTDNSTLEVHTSGYLKVKDAGVQTQHIGDDQVTYAKMQDVSANSVIGNPTSSSANPQAISISDLSSDIATELGNATTSADGLMSSTDKNKLDNIDDNANNYSHPTGDGNLHVPATGTTNDGKVLTAGSTAGSLSWTAIQTGVADGSVTTAKLADNAVTAAKITDTDSTFNIDSSGNVGVGIAPPQGGHIAKLYVSGTGNTYLAVSSDTMAGIDLDDTGAGTDQRHYQLVTLDGKYEIRQMNDDFTIKRTPFVVDTNGDIVITGDIKKGGSVYGGASVYTSSETAIPAVNTTETWTHSLGQAPDSIQLILRCKIAEYGYSVGDEVRYTSEYTAASTYNFWANSTEIGLRGFISAGASIFHLVRRDITGALTQATPANWKIVVKGIVF